MNADNYVIASYRAQQVANHLRNAHERKVWSTLDVHGYSEARAKEELALLAADMGFQLIQINPPAEAPAEPVGHVVWRG